MSNLYPWKLACKTGYHEFYGKYKVKEYNTLCYLDNSCDCYAGYWWPGVEVRLEGLGSSSNGCSSDPTVYMAVVSLTDMPNKIMAVGVG